MNDYVAVEWWLDIWMKRKHFLPYLLPAYGKIND